jgi:hypothetical protein
MDAGLRPQADLLLGKNRQSVHQCDPQDGFNRSEDGVDTQFHLLLVAHICRISSFVIIWSSSTRIYIYG